MIKRIIASVAGLLVGVVFLVSISKSNTVILTTPETVESAAQWQPIINELENGSAKHIILKIDGYGGNVNLGEQVVNAIQDAQAKGKTVDGIIIAAAYSMHADITCYLNNIAFTSAGSLYFHGIKIENALGMPLPIDASTQHEEDALFNQCKAKGLLTDDDISKIEKGSYVSIYVDSTGKFTKIYGLDI